jgi:hypothetical protein
VAGLKTGCASALATACAKTALQPFDAAKTLQQVEEQGFRRKYTG